MDLRNTWDKWPDANGRFGEFGGRYVAETLMPLILDLEKEYRAAKQDPAFKAQMDDMWAHYVGRPSPLYFAERLTEHFDGAKIYFKRDELNHTGAHKINNCLGQVLLAMRMGKTRIIAETGAGQHGVATATMAARFGFDCTIYMGAVDVARQRPNVFWMEQLGATVVAVEDGSATLKDAINEALRDWANSMEDTHYVLGTACGPHPFPTMVAWLQRIIGEEARAQMLEQEGRLPDRVYACVGGGSNATGMFLEFLGDDEVELVGVEAGGHGIPTGRHAARLVGGDGSPGVAQGYKTYFLQDDDGQMRHTHSVSAGLDYVGVSPILAHLYETGRVRFESATDEEVIAAMRQLMRSEGIIGALESAHAVAGALSEAASTPEGSLILINLSGRGDKDIFTIGDALGDERWVRFLKEKAATL